jgi:hypothetical protein
MFDRAVWLLILLAETGDDGHPAKEATDIFESLFTIYLSGTHATIEQRLGAVEPLLRSDNPRRQNLGLRALRSVLQAWHFSSHYSFDFGARSRDFGYQPRTRADVVHWYGSALRAIEPFACKDDSVGTTVRTTVAQAFRGLWTRGGMYDALERICRGIARRGFWREGWIAIRQTRQFDSKGMPSDVADRLAALDAEIRPDNLIDRIRAIVFSNRGGISGFNLDDLEEEEPSDYSAAIARMDAAVEQFGRITANDRTVFEALLAELVTADGRLWGFGRGLGLGAEEPRQLWDAFVSQLADTPRTQQNVHVLCGFLAVLIEKDAVLANTLLDEALTHPVLAEWFPILQIAAAVDIKGVARLKRALALNEAPVGTYGFLRMGRATDPITGPDLKELVLTIASQNNGYDVALEILAMRLHGDRSAKRDSVPEVVETGCELLGRLDFTAQQRREDHNLDMIVRASLKGDDGVALAGEICRKLAQATADYRVSAHDHHDLLAGLIATQPMAVLDALFGGDVQARNSGVRAISEIEHITETNPLTAIADDIVLAWCDRDATLRYPLIASVITPFSPSENATLQWTGLVRQLLTRSPDQLAVLKELVGNFQPLSWSGSRATIMESRLPLLDDPFVRDDPTLASFVEESRVELKRVIEIERRAETERDKTRDERFE